MFHNNILVYLIGLVAVKLIAADPKEITFEIHSQKSQDDVSFICDHNDPNNPKRYTVMEGEEMKINIKFNYFINHLFCHDYADERITFAYEKNRGNKNKTTFKVQKSMGTLWKCKLLALRDSPILRPVVQYKNHKYSAAYCFMNIHVRQAKSPQTILVNNMVLPAVRTDLSEKNVDFTAEYQYADGGVVNVICANFLNGATLTMEYPLADTLSDKFDSTRLQSAQAIGVVTKLYSKHNNSYMICKSTEPTDYTKVMVRFVILNKSYIVNIKINGITLRPKLTVMQNNYYEIEYKYARYHRINVTCEVERTDVKLFVYDDDLRDGKERSYIKRELIPGRKAEMSFYLISLENKNLVCASDYLDGSSAEIVNIRFTEDDSLLDYFQLHMELPSNGTVMELNSHNHEKVIFYEFEDGEALELMCKTILPFRTSWPMVYVQFKDSELYKLDAVSKTLYLTGQDDNTKITCQLKELTNRELGPSNADVLRNEIIVILRKKDFTPTSSAVGPTLSFSETAGSVTESIAHAQDTRKGNQDYNNSEKENREHSDDKLINEKKKHKYATAIDKKNRYFVDLLLEDLQLLPECMRPRAHDHILTYLETFKKQTKGKSCDIHN